MKRVVVIGSGGSGKSTFSRELGRVTGIPVIHLDREYWRPGWEETPRDDWANRVAELVAGEHWIMDGNFGGTREIRMRAADTIIFLDLPRRVITDISRDLRGLCLRMNFKKCLADVHELNSLFNMNRRRGI